MAKRDNPPASEPDNSVQHRAEFPRVVLRSIGKEVSKGGFGILEMEVPVRWQPGDSLSWDDALFINYAHAYYAGSNFVNRMKKLQEEGKTEAEICEAFAAYIAKYSWSPAGKFDPVESEARRLARPVVVAAIKAAGKDAEDEAAVDTAVERLLDLNPDFRINASLIVNARNAAKTTTASIDLTALGL